MTQITIKEFGIKIFQRDSNNNDSIEKVISQTIKDMSKKGIISLQEFKRIFNESTNETIEIFTDSLIENSENIIDSSLNIIQKGK